MNYLFLFLCCCSSIVWGQKELVTKRTNEKITIDGNLEEETWNNLPAGNDFIQVSPAPGKPSEQQTSIKLTYDDQALYVAVICYDQPDKVSKILSLRDDFHANIDNIQVTLDTYNDDQNGFVFGVSSMGVQYDAKIYQGSDSPELDMVWQSAVKHTEQGWQLEMRIPYAAFRFPKVTVQNWGINVSRYISRNREKSTWSQIKPDFDNYIAQCGKLTGVEGIEPPLRLAFIPYLSYYVDHFDQKDPEVKNWSHQFNGGMDIKLGLNEAFTLDMTLVPDFGQVVFDNQVLNLSPFEIQFNENRQFFTEGTELFNKAGLFYSRRIGIQAPRQVLTTLLDSNEVLNEVPQASQLYNASKISGRTKKGLGIGIFNAITAPQKAKAFNTKDSTEREVLISPLSNFNVLVLDQNLKNNSYVTFTNTNVTRAGSFYDANVTGLDTKFNTKDNTFFISNWMAVSGKYEPTSSQFGHTFGGNIGKQKGNFIYNTSYHEESNTYNPNDLGFLANNNKRLISQVLHYRIFEPFWKINQFSAKLEATYSRLYKPNVYTSTTINLNSYVNTKKFHAFGFSVNNSVTPTYDYFEPRVWGNYYIRPVSILNSVWASSNYQKKFAMDAEVNWNYIRRNDWKEWGYSLSPRWRVNDKVFLIYNWEHVFYNNQEGYAVQFGTPVQTSNAIVFGNRNRIDVTNTVNLRYTLTKVMGFTFRLRHYRSNVKYNYFYDLQTDGTLTRNNMTGLDVNNESAYNTNFNAFTIDWVYRWVFRPGSEINVVWKNAIFTNDKRVSESYLRNLQSTFDNSAVNSISFKVLYWLDYQEIKHQLKKSHA